MKKARNKMTRPEYAVSLFCFDSFVFPSCQLSQEMRFSGAGCKLISSSFRGFFALESCVLVSNVDNFLAIHTRTSVKWSAFIWSLRGERGLPLS